MSNPRDYNINLDIALGKGRWKKTGPMRDMLTVFVAVLLYRGGVFIQSSCSQGTNPVIGFLIAVRLMSYETQFGFC